MSIKQALAARVFTSRTVLPLLRMAAGAFTKFRPTFLHIDQPAEPIDRVVCVLQGWFFSSAGGRSPTLRIGGVDLTWVPVERPDVQRIFTGQHCHGFQAILDLNRAATLEDIAHRQVHLDLLLDGRRVVSAPLKLAAHLRLTVESAAQGREEKRRWLRDRLVCPFCAGELAFTERGMCCRSCDHVFEDDGYCFNFLPDHLKQKFRINDWSDISAHPYDDVAKSIIEEVRGSGGKVLDCGSGLRAGTDENIICVDVASFPTVDVLAVNQRLPFRSGVFDAVFSLNVLEHVTDPFACAAELVRVLKPGAKLYCCIPFLQPEHGYPDHYFNATRSGLRQLFRADLELLQHVVPTSGEPVWTLHWFLAWYLRELPDREKKRFLNMRVRDIVERSAMSLLDEPWVAKLSEQGKWQLASTTAAVFRKLDA